MNCEGVYQTVGRKIRELRERKKLSQEDLCEQLSIARPSLTNIERGKQRIMLHTLCQVAAALETELQEFLPKLNELGSLEAESSDSKELTSEDKNWVEKVRQEAKSALEK